ncbi:MAG TPA: hypothetical protein VF796_23890 [Humisphaera sp.]
MPHRTEGHAKVQAGQPIVLAMVICDAIYADPATGKRTLLGLFGQTASAQFPLVVPQLSVYLAMTDVHGRTPVQVRLVDANEERPAVFVAEGFAEADDPLAVIETSWFAQQVVLPAPGEYRLQLSANGRLLMERRLSAVQIGAPLAS